jgi:carbon-monoxide dehydrogenase small subunit
MKNVHLALRVNGEEHEVSFPPHATLLEVVRERMGLTGTKHGCELGECGACAVLVDGKAVLSCLTLGLEMEGREIMTIEGVAGATSELHPLQAAFADLGGAQCGYCTPAMILTAKALLDREPGPSRERIADALSGNICRCTGYLQILDAVEKAAEVMRSPSAGAAEEAGG